MILIGNKSLVFADIIERSVLMRPAFFTVYIVMITLALHAAVLVSVHMIHIDG